MADNQTQIDNLLKECLYLEECAFYSMKGHFNDINICTLKHKDAAHSFEELLAVVKDLRMDILNLNSCNDVDLAEKQIKLYNLLLKKCELNAKAPLISQEAYEKVKKDIT